MADTFLIVLYTLRISVLLIVTWVLHTKVGEYTTPLPPSDNPRREIQEAILLWSIMFAIASIFAFFIYTSGIFLPSDQYSPALLVLWIGVYTLPGFVIPLFVVLFVNKWNSRTDLGLSSKIQQRQVWIYVILIQILLIFAELSIRGSPATAPVFFLLISLWGTAFLEEFLYRGVIQAKLERAIGQTKGWLYGGIIFGLAHIPANFFAPIWIAGSVDLVAGLLMLGVQIVNGWWYGITFTKTRSLIPCIIIHYLADFFIIYLAWILLLL